MKFNNLMYVKKIKSKYVIAIEYEIKGKRLSIE